jgi:hypothetical protein
MDESEIQPNDHWNQPYKRPCGAYAPGSHNVASPMMAEEILVNMNGVPNVVTEVCNPLQASYPPLREAPVVKENPVLQNSVGNLPRAVYPNRMTN